MMDRIVWAAKEVRADAMEQSNEAYELWKTAPPERKEQLAIVIESMNAVIRAFDMFGAIIEDPSLVRAGTKEGNGR